MMKECPNCKRLFAWNPNMGQDYVHQCDSKNDYLDKEPVLKTGDWEDYSGSGTVANPHLQGLGTKASGKALAKGENIEDLNRWGKRKKLYRERKHYHYIENTGEL